MAFVDDNIPLDIDEDLHLHHLAAYGRKAMLRISNSNVLVSGMQALGAEIAKNLILAGMKSVTLQDEGLVELSDLSSNFIFTENDVGKNRAVASVEKLQELNNAVAVSSLTTELTIHQLSGFQAVVFTGIGLKKAIELDNYCHNHQPPIVFIKAEVRGLFGSAICDLGPTYTILDDGDDPCSTALISSITNTNPALVACVNIEGPKFENGDMVVFSGVKGMIQLNDNKQRRILESRPNLFILDENTRNFSAYKGGGIVKKVRQPMVIESDLLEDVIRNPRVPTTPILHLAFQALDQFVSEQGCLPRARSEEDAQKLISIVEILNEELVGNRKLKNIHPKLLQQFAFGSSAVLSPMAGIFGGIVGQQVINACSGKPLPFQFYYFESVRSLPTEPLEAADFMPLNSRYNAQISVFGCTLQKKLQDAKVFVVGSGALGCEFLKNFALMGVSCGEEGKLTITDDDVIAKHNLCSHFLFREGHIGQPKTTVAAELTKASINQQLNIEALQNRVGRETENAFNDAFWERLDVVVNALDDLDSKLYVDKRCLYFKKPFLESATLDTRIMTHMVIPDLTENYVKYRYPPQQYHKGNYDRHADLTPAMANMGVVRHHVLPRIEEHKANLIAAGKTTPCIATTSAVAAGLVCLELYKVLDGGHKREQYRNVVADLSEFYVNSYKPVPPTVTEYPGTSWTVWDRWVIKNNPTIKQVFDWVAEKGLKALSVYCEDFPLYSVVNPSDELLNEKVVELVKKMPKGVKPVIPAYRSHVDVVIICVDDRKEMISLPLVSVYFRELS